MAEGSGGRRKSTHIRGAITTSEPPHVDCSTKKQANNRHATLEAAHKVLTSQPWVMWAPICCTRSKMCSARDPFVI